MRDPVTPERVTKTAVFTALGTDDTVDLKRSRVYNHRLTWTRAGTSTTGNIKLEQSVDGVTWSDLIASQDATSNNTATATGWVNYVRIKCTAISGAGNTVYVSYEGTPYVAASSATAMTASNGDSLTATSNALDINIKSGLSSDAAVGAAVSTNPIPITGKAVATQPAVVDAGDANYPSFTLDGRLIVKESAPPQDEWQFSTAGTSIVNQTPVAVKALDTGYYQAVTSVLVTNSHATTGTVVQFTDGSGGTVIYEGYAAPAGGGFAANGGVTSLFIVPTVSHALYVQEVTTTATNGIQVNVRGYKTKVAP